MLPLSYKGTESAMYDRNRLTVAGRIIWFVVSLLILLGLIWLVLWLFLWRSPQTSTSGTQPTKTTQQGTDTSKQSQSTSSGSSVAQPGSTPQSTGVTSSTSTTTPAIASPVAQGSSLANTGPGNLVTPVILAMLGGAAYYHVRQRRSIQDKR